MKIVLIIIVVLALVAGLIVIRLRRDEPVAISDMGGPGFAVRVERPFSARPFFGLLSGSELRFDNTSSGAKVGIVRHNHVELSADGWNLFIETNDKGEIVSGTRLVFPIELGGRQVMLRCRPADPASGYLDIAKGTDDKLDGSFLIKLAACENAVSEKPIEWPPAPLTLSGNFKGVQSVDSQFRVIVPKAWEHIFFPPIYERAGIAKLPSLRTQLPKGDLELRLWNGFGLTALEGFVLARKSGNWSAIHLNGIYPKLPKNEYQKQLSAPKSGWDAAWSRLLKMELLTLPDAAEIECSGATFDGFSYVVEINYENTYRTYLYDNPSVAGCEQAKKMIAIGNFIADEFGVREMRTMKY